MSCLVHQEHPLLAWRPEKIRSWAEWMELWQSSMYFEQRMGLLHCGFDVDALERQGIGLSEWHDRHREITVRRICFYLDVADGHDSNELFLRQEEYDRWRAECVEGTRADLAAAARAALACKAFAVLAQRFFKDTGRRHGEPSWVSLAVEDDVLRQLVRFFHLDENYSMPNLRTSRDSVSHQWARAFQLELCKMGWNYCYGNRHSGLEHEIRQRLEAFRPQFIEMLLGSGNIFLLLDQRKYPLDEPSWLKLEELALGEQRIRNPQDGLWRRQKPVNLEEAVASGSQAAQVLMLRRNMEREDARFAALRESVLQRREAERRIEDLSQG